MRTNLDLAIPSDEPKINSIMSIDKIGFIAKQPHFLGPFPCPELNYLAGIIRSASVSELNRLGQRVQFSSSLTLFRPNFGIDDHG